MVLTGFYASLIALLLLALTINVIRLRFKYRVGIGDKGYDELAQAIRAHGNLTEYLPIVLILFACAEYQQLSVMWLHLLGGLFFVGRVLHASGLLKSKTESLPRKLGSISTFIVIIGLSLFNIGQLLR